MSAESRLGWIDGADELPLSRQCELAEVARATVYRRLTAQILLAPILHRADPNLTQGGMLRF